MKYFSIILSLIIITLIAIPCDHEPAAVSETAVITSQHENDSENYSELCSPFSTNDSCATMVILPEIFEEDFPNDLIGTDINIGYSITYTKDFSYSIFQPPRA